MIPGLLGRIRDAVVHSAPGRAMELCGDCRRTRRTGERLMAGEDPYSDDTDDDDYIESFW